MSVPFPKTTDSSSRSDPPLFPLPPPPPAAASPATSPPFPLKQPARVPSSSSTAAGSSAPAPDPFFTPTDATVAPPAKAAATSVRQQEQRLLDDNPPPFPTILGPSIGGSGSSSSSSSSVTASQPLSRLDVTRAAHYYQQHPPNAESSGSSSVLGHVPEDIEMDAMTPAGHRRRRSSLINPANVNNGHRSSRPRAPSIRNPLTGQEEPKILEEDSSETDALNPSSETREGGYEEDLTDEDLHDDEETGLTHKDKRRKRKKKRRNTLLDQRIVREKISDEEKKQVDQSVLKNILINCLLIGLWYIFSLCISLYNKWMFDPERLDFPFPLFTTAVHMLVQFTLASLVLYFIPSLRPQNAHKSDLGQSRHEAEPERPLMTKMFYLTRIGPCGAATGLDIGLGNTSLKFITLTFYTMCKSSSLAFVLLFAFLFRLEAPTWKLVTIIATMTLGVVMMVAGEVEFKLGGFILVISAAFFSGFRWGLTQILLLRNPATSNPFSSIFFLAPVMFLTLIVIAIPVEGFGPLFEGLKIISDTWGPLLTPLLILFPGTIAFLMTASEFALLKRTSVVTLSIAGIFKEAVTISAAALVFGDTLTPINFVGLFVTLASIVAYNWIKITKMREEAQAEVRRTHLEGEAAGGSGSGAFLSSPSTSGSDVEGEDGNEETAGLLRQQEVDVEDALFTADGDMIPKPEGSPMSAAELGHNKGGRED